MNKKLLKFCLLATTATGSTLALSEKSHADSHDKVSVAVSSIVEHPALDAVRDGLLEGLSQAGYIEGKNLKFDFQTAQGKPDIAVQIARQFVSDNPDVLVGIATLTAQALASATTSIPIVFTAVTDPVGAKLLKSMASPEGNVTGISDLSPVAQHIDIMAQIVPGLKTIGIVYNPGEDNSVSLVKLIKAAASKKGIEVKEGTATRTSELTSATQSIAADVDIFYAITDNTLASAIASFTSTASEAKKPVFAAETSFVDEGALAAVGFDYFQIGVQTAEYVVKILNGAKPSSLPAKVATGTDIVINTKVAAELGITLPSSLTSNPTRIVK